MGVPRVPCSLDPFPRPEYNRQPPPGLSRPGASCLSPRLFTGTQLDEGVGCGGERKSRLLGENEGPHGACSDIECQRVSKGFFRAGKSRLPPPSFLSLSRAFVAPAWKPRGQGAGARGPQLSGVRGPLFVVQRDAAYGGACVAFQQWKVGGECPTPCSSFPGAPFPPGGAGPRTWTC